MFERGRSHWWPQAAEGRRSRHRIRASRGHAWSLPEWHWLWHSPLGPYWEPLQERQTMNNEAEKKKKKGGVGWTHLPGQWWSSHAWTKFGLPPPLWALPGNKSARFKSSGGGDPGFTLRREETQNQQQGEPAGGQMEEEEAKCSTGMIFCCQLLQLGLHRGAFGNLVWI